MFAIEFRGISLYPYATAEPVLCSVDRRASKFRAVLMNTDDRFTSFRRLSGGRGTRWEALATTGTCSADSGVIYYARGTCFPVFYSLR